MKGIKLSLELDFDRPERVSKEVTKDRLDISVLQKMFEEEVYWLDSDYVEIHKPDFTFTYPIPEQQDLEYIEASEETS